MSPAPESGVAPSLAAAALQGLCPRCASRSLFDGAVRFADRCPACGLDFQSYNVGDGPAAFLILIIGALVTAGAIVVDLSFSPPWWVHLIWLPITASLTVYGLRLGKSALLFQEHRHRAGEGRLAK